MPICKLLKNHIRSNFHHRNIFLTGCQREKAVDPIQQMFIDKIREYKSKAGPGYKLYMASESLLKERSVKLDRIAAQHGVSPGTDMTKFPEITFKEPKLDPIEMDKK